jgi:hypothetical protein
MTTNQDTEMASLNDEASAEDAALTDHENEEALGSPPDLLNMVSLCEDTKKCCVIFKRMVKGVTVKVACGHLAEGCTRPSHDDLKKNNSNLAAKLWYEAVPSRQVTDGLLDGSVLTAEAYEEARAQAALDPERDEDATDGEATDNSEGDGREREPTQQPAATAMPRTRRSSLSRAGRTVRRTRSSARAPPLDAPDSDALDEETTDCDATDNSVERGGRERVRFAAQPSLAKQQQAQDMPRTRSSVLSKVGRTVRRTNGRSSEHAIPLETCDTGYDYYNYKRDEWFGLVDPYDELERTICQSQDLPEVEQSGRTSSDCAMRSTMSSWCSHQYAAKIPRQHTPRTIITLIGMPTFFMCGIKGVSEWVVSILRC